MLIKVKSAQLAGAPNNYVEPFTIMQTEIMKSQTYVYMYIKMWLILHQSKYYLYMEEIDMT